MIGRIHLLLCGVIWTTWTAAQSYTWMPVEHPILVGNSVQSMAVSPDNTLWVGTHNGLINKKLGVVYTVENSGIPDSDVRSVGVGADGGVWVGTFDGGMAIYADDEWRVINTSNSALPDNFVRCFWLSADTSWVGTAGGLVRMVGDTISAVFTMENSVLQSNNITDLEVDAEGVLWVGTINGGLTRFAYDESARSFTIANSGILDNSIMGLCIDNQHNKWLATPYGGLHILTSAGIWIVAQTENSPMPSNSLFSIVWDNAWGGVVGTQDTGVVVVQGNTFERFNGSNTPLNDSAGRINVLLVQHDTLWIGTSGGGVYGVYRSYTSAISESVSSSGGVWVYSNPASDMLYIVCPEDIAEVQLYSLQGVLVASRPCTDGCLSVELPIAATLARGVYVLRVHTYKGGNWAKVVFIGHI